MNERNARRPVLAWALIGLQALMGVSAVISGGMLVAAPDGSLMGMPASMLEPSPFADFLVPGAILFLFLGLYPLAVAYGLWRRPRWGWAESLNPLEGNPLELGRIAGGGGHPGHLAHRGGGDDPVVRRAARHLLRLGGGAHPPDPGPRGAAILRVAGFVEGRPMRQGGFP